jgi:hypothetical protein
MKRYTIIANTDIKFESREFASAVTPDNSETVRILSADEEKEFRAEIIEECKNQLLLHLAEVIYKQNDYPIRAVPQAIILSLPALMNIKSEVNNWKREFAWEWYKKSHGIFMSKMDEALTMQIFESEWKEVENNG